MDQSQLTNRIKVAAQNDLADLVIKNGQIIDVFNGDIFYGDVAIKDGYFVGIGKYEGKVVIDAKNRFISPSFIDGHVHIESSMVCGPEFAKVQLLHGVTTVITDPHEIANVSGAKGIQFMLDSTEDLPFNFYFMLPSCVPATSFEQSGASLNSEDLLPFYDHPRVLGLAEVMNYPGVLNADQDMVAKLIDAHNHSKKIDGHAAGLKGRELDVYMTAGIRTDHECTTAEEALERLRKGMYVMIREGTVAKDLKQVIKVVTERNSRRCLFVTDDRHLDDVFHEGSIDHQVRLAISEGIHEITAIQMATINAAECFGLHELGAIAPGYKADFLLLDNLRDVRLSSVFKNGIQIVNQGSLIDFPENALQDYSELTNSVRFSSLSQTSFDIPVPGKLANIIEIVPNTLITKHLVEHVSTNETGLFIPSVNGDQLKLAVIERHHMTGSIGLGIVKGLGLKSGAIATTVAHDSHNLIIAGTSDEDMYAAAREIKKMQGGLVVIKNGLPIAHLELEIAGLMTSAKYEVVYNKLLEIEEAIKQLGGSQDFNPFLTLAFLALPVIPELKLTDKGLFNVKTFRYMEVEAHKSKEKYRNESKTL